MKNKTLITSLWISSFFIFLIVLGTYIIKFWSFDISHNPEHWGQFGDFVGGVLNPLISLVNLIILSYLSIRLVKDEDNRNEWTLKELARPYGEVSYIRKQNSVKIKIHNIGLGPMIITEIKIIDNKGKVYPDFEHLREKIIILSEFSFGTASLSDNHHAIGKDETVTLLNLSNDDDDDDDNPSYLNLSIKIRKLLNEYRLEIKYSDMYKREIDTLRSAVLFKTD